MKNGFECVAHLFWCCYCSDRMPEAVKYYPAVARPTQDSGEWL
jgi:hypothetical protein